MKKTLSLILAIVIAGSCLFFNGCQEKSNYTVGICQLMEHDSLDQATQGFVDALQTEMDKAGKTVTIETQVAGEADLCLPIINTYTAKKVDLIMANATPALLAAANGTASIPVLGTSVTDYQDTFQSGIPGNVSGTSDAVPFDQQAQMMIDTLQLQEADQVGVLYCINESNSKVQYDAVKALFEEKGIAVKAYTFSEITELQALVTNMAAECKAIYIPSDNTVAKNDAIVGTICQENSIPVYTSYASTIGYASLAIDYYQLGVETGKMAAQILLEGKSPADIEIATLTPSVTYNKALCEALGIQIPEG